MNVSSTAKPSASPEAIVDRLFVKLGAMYGKAWLDMWTGAPIAEVKAEWAARLHGVAPESIRLALEHMVTEGRPFPPNLPEFVSMVKQFARKGPHALRALQAPRYDAPENVFANLRKQLHADDAA